MPNKIFECQICGIKACEHASDMIESLDLDTQILVDALDALENLMGFVDTPMGYRKFSSDFANQARESARQVLEKSGRWENGCPKKKGF
jgi:hypothetical protein